jgi:hypothetical protein
VGRTLYPLYKLAKIFSTPPDVKPDWLDAAKKALEAARTLFRCTEEDKALLNEAEHVVRKRESRIGEGVEG